MSEPTVAPKPVKPSILVMLDPDPQPSLFDAVVGIDAGVDHLLRYGGVTVSQVRDLVHGAIFTRGPADLKRTAIFVGGSDVDAAERLMEAVHAAFFSDFRVSTMLDPNGANTTAAAAIRAGLKSLGRNHAQAGPQPLEGIRTAVLGGTGPVGRRVARLAARLGAQVALGSRDLLRAQQAIHGITQAAGLPTDRFTPFDRVEVLSEFAPALVVACGAAGVTLLGTAERDALVSSLHVIIDLNAVPPAGVEGVAVTAKDQPLTPSDPSSPRVWGALGVGGLKMKLHRRVVQMLFETSQSTFDAETILDVARTMD